MNIHPRPDQELAIKEAIRAGLIKSEVDALDIGLESLRSKLMDNFNSQITDADLDIELESLRSKLIRFGGLSSKRTPQEAATHIREQREGNFLPSGVTIRDLINEGRA